MTGRRGTLFSRFPRLLTSVALAAAAISTSLLSGCGPLQKASADAEGPVVVMTWAPEGTKATNSPGMPAMAQAYARWINSRGGVNGRELKVLTCNERNDTVGAGHCARQAIAHDVVAVVGSYSQHGRAFMSRLESAGIPYIGGYGLTEEEFTSPLSYPVNGGVATLLAGNGRQLGHACRRVFLVRPDTIAGDEMPSLLNAGLLQSKQHPADDVRAPEDATEYTAQAQKVLEAAGADPSLHGVSGYGSAPGDACVTAVLGDHTDTFFDSFRRLQADRPRMRIASVLGSVQQSLVTRTGGKSSPFEGAYVTGWYPPAGDPRWDPMRKVIRRHAFGDNRIDPADPGVQTTWIAYQVLRSAIDSLGDGPVTAHSLQRALDGRIGKGGIDTGGLTPKLSWRYEDLLAVHGYPRIANSMVTYQQVRDGRLVSMRDGFVDVSTTLEQRPSDG
jgi:ABC-type branched-subunit amino acid transport system substrate-binding protein